MFCGWALLPFRRTLAQGWPRGRFSAEIQAGIAVNCISFRQLEAKQHMCKNSQKQSNSLKRTPCARCPSDMWLLLQGSRLRRWKFRLLLADDARPHPVISLPDLWRTLQPWSEVQRAKKHQRNPWLRLPIFTHLFQGHPTPLSSAPRGNQSLDWSCHVTPRCVQ